MAQKNREARATEHVDAHETATTTPVIQPAMDRDFVSANRPALNIASVEIVKPLTPPLVAMAHQGKLLFEAASEPFKMQLPVKGRSESVQDATVVEGYNLETGEFIILICNTMMVSAFKKAGDPLKGKQFAIANNNIMADKNYRHIEVVQVRVDLEPAPSNQ